MDTVQSKDGTKIAFERSGSGPALVLVDGALCHRGFGPAFSCKAPEAAFHCVYV